MSQPELVFAETSPYDSVEAIIEQDDQVAYFYLRAINNDRFRMKSCWLRNLVEAPEELDRERMAQGLPPTLPGRFCRFTEPQSRLNESELRIVWFEEGDGASLLENDQVLAIIPAWSGSEEFDGFARDCQTACPLCQPLPDSGHPLQRRIVAADRFWKSWETDSSPWNQYEPEILAAYESVFGPSTGYFSIDGGKWPPRTLAKFHWNEFLLVLTVGVSVCPQPGLESVFENPKPFRRFEWGACFDKDISPALVESFCRYLSGQVSLPWNHQTFLAQGHTVSCDLFLQSNLVPDFSAIMLLANERLEHEGWQGMPNVFGDPVNLFWSVPVFENERKFVQDTNNFGPLQELVAQDLVPVIRNRSTLV